MFKSILTVAALCCLTVIVQAADKSKSPNQILDGKAAATGGSGNFHNGTGSYAGRTSSNGRSTSV